MTNKRTIDHFKACMIGGAIGDAMGAPIEFKSLDWIRATFGHQGLTSYSEVYGRLGAFTDDTQMTLFTAEGLILSKVRQEYQGSDGMVSSVYKALLRCLVNSYALFFRELLGFHSGIFASCYTLDLKDTV